VAQPYIIIWPAHEEVIGIHVSGRCIDGSPMHALAHAHTHKHDKNYGWICCRPSQVPSLGILEDTDTDTPYIVEPGILALHELAHLRVRVSTHGHGYEYRRALTALAIFYPNMEAQLEAEAEDYRRREHRTVSVTSAAAGHFLVGQRVKVAAHAKPVALRGQVAIVRKVGRTRLSVAFVNPEHLGRYARYTYWPASLVEPA
jgi:hypothetical protein